MKTWEQRREKAIRDGCYSLNETSRIKLALSFKEIKERLKDKEIFRESTFEGVVRHLKSEVYLKRIRNTKKDLTEGMFDYEISLREMFQKLFWEEYVYSYDIWDDTDLKQVQKRAEILTKIKNFLDKNPKYLEYCGSRYQNSELWNKIKRLTGMTLSMRAWGGLMAAYMNSKIEKRKYDYMSYYYNW